TRPPRDHPAQRFEVNSSSRSKDEWGADRAGFPALSIEYAALRRQSPVGGSRKPALSSLRTVSCPLRTEDNLRVFILIGKDSTDAREFADLLQGGPPDPRGRGRHGCRSPVSGTGDRFLASLASSRPDRRADRPAYRAGCDVAGERRLARVPPRAGRESRGPAAGKPGPVHRAGDRGQSRAGAEAGHQGRPPRAPLPPPPPR